MLGELMRLFETGGRISRALRRYGFLGLQRAVGARFWRCVVGS